ncbi:MAG: hypothetical protein U1E34_09520 [Amaricoccus sp.]
MTAGEILLDDKLVRALSEGMRALPEDLGQLAGYLRLLDGLLWEKASEHEETWRQLAASAAEIETLLGLQNAVAERAIVMRAETLPAVLLKFDIWRALGAGAEDQDSATDWTATRERLVRSIEADLVRMVRGTQE